MLLGDGRVDAEIARDERGWGTYSRKSGTLEDFR